MKLLKKVISILLIGSSAWGTEIPHTSKTDLKLGRGYNSANQLAGQFCLKPEYDIDGSSSSTVKVLTSISERELEKELGFGIKGRYKTGATTASAEADFLKTSKSNGFSVSYTFKSNYEFPSRALKKYEWTEEAKAQLKIIPKQGGILPDEKVDPNNWTGKVTPLNPNHWYEKCGDEVITSQTLGARFYFNIKVVFSNETDFNKFTTGFDLTSPTVDISADFKTQMKKMSSRTEVVVSALQLGGQVDKITGIFGGDSKHFVQCSGGKLDDCMVVLESAIKYATDIRPLSEGGTGFPAQIDPNIEPGKYGGPAVLSSITQKYKNITNYQEPSQALQKLSGEVEKQLNLLFDEVFNEWTYALQVKQTGLPRLNPEQERSLGQVTTESYDDLIEIVDVIERCYNDVTSCPIVYLEVDPAHNQEIGHMYDSEKTQFVDYSDWLAFEPESFAALCDYHKGKLLSRRLSHTIEELINYVDVCEGNAENKKCALDDVVDECGTVQSVLEDKEKIELEDKGITDLTPFSWFTNLISLNLAGNKLDSSDLEPLKKLTRLEELDLGRNFLKKVGPLAEMKSLLVLKVNGNQLKDLSDLSNIDLELLDASSNRGKLVCPYTETEICILVDFSRQTSFSTAPSTNGERRFHGEMIDLNDQYLLLIGGRELSYLELVDKRNLRHIKLDMRVGNRMGATYSKISENEVLISGGFGVENHVVKISIDFASREAKSQIVQSFGAEQFSQQSIELDDGRILVTGGYRKKAGSSTLVVSDAYIYDMASGRFDLLPDGMKEPRADHQMVKAPNGQVYIIGGKSYNMATGERPSNTIEVFDPQSNTFRTVGERMYSPRSGHTATLVDDDTILIAGGFDVAIPGSLFHDVSVEDQKNIEASRSAELFFISSESLYEVPRALNKPRANHEAVRLEDGKILLVGGQRHPANFSYDTPSCGVCEKSAEIFDPKKDIFIGTGSLMSYERVNFMVAPLPDRRVYISGGVGQGASIYSEIFSYSNLD